jgi:cytochrome P450
MTITARHLAFGPGIHFCLGDQPASIEGKCTFKALFGRWPKLEITVQPEEIRWRKRPGLMAVEKLTVVAGAQ